MDFFSQNLHATHANPAKSLSESYSGRWPFGAREAQGQYQTPNFRTARICAATCCGEHESSARSPPHAWAGSTALHAMRLVSRASHTRQRSSSTAVRQQLGSMPKHRCVLLHLGAAGSRCSSGRSDSTVIASERMLVPRYGAELNSVRPVASTHSHDKALEANGAWPRTAGRSESQTWMSLKRAGSARLSAELSLRHLAALDFEDFLCASIRGSSGQRGRWSLSACCVAPL